MTVAVICIVCVVSNVICRQPPEKALYQVVASSSTSFRISLEIPSSCYVYSKHSQSFDTYEIEERRFQCVGVLEKRLAGLLCVV